MEFKETTRGNTGPVPGTEQVIQKAKLLSPFLLTPKDLEARGHDVFWALSLLPRPTLG